MGKTILAALALLILATGVVFYSGSAFKNPAAPETPTNVTVVGVVMNGPVNDDGWTTAHHRAFESIKDDLNLKMLYKENVPPGPDAVNTIRDLVRQGARIVFATSFGFGDAINQCADEFPNVTFFHCSGMTQKKNLTSYMGRIYQMRYLSGIAAGLQTNTNEIGYVAAMRIDEVVRGINAFALGARSVNPNAHIRVVWTGDWMNYEKERTAALQLMDKHNIDVIAYHQDTDAVIRAAADRRITAIGYNIDKGERYPGIVLTSPIWNWAPYYRKQILSVIKNRYKPGQHWDGAKTGIVALAPLAYFAKPGIRTAIENAHEKLTTTKWDVFTGPITDNKGNQKAPPNKPIPDPQLLTQSNWFTTGITEEPNSP